MQRPKAALLSAVAALALVTGTSAVLAQSNRAERTQTIEVPAGATVIVLPPGGAMPLSPFTTPHVAFAGPMLDAASPIAPMPDAVAMIRQMNRMMDQMMVSAHEMLAQPGWLNPNRTVEAAMPGMPQLGDSVQGVVVTSFSDGRGTCTQRVVYPGNGAAPKVEVSATGNACASLGTPSAAPEVTAPHRATVPRTIEVRDRVRPAHRPAPLEVAELVR